jgi:hypothetical protein
LGNVCPVPCDVALGGLGDGGKDVHEPGFAGAIGPEKTQNARTELQAEILKSPKDPSVSFANTFDEKLQSFLADEGPPKMADEILL